MNLSEILARGTWLNFPTRGTPPASSPPLSEEVLTRLEIEFPPEQRADVRHELLWYGADRNDSEVDRMRIAVLDLADGDLKDVRYYARHARQDFRDILYPVARLQAFASMLGDRRLAISRAQLRDLKELARRLAMPAADLKGIPVERG